MRLPIYTVEIAGLEIEDAFIYRSFVYLWTFDSRMLVLRISDVVAHISQATTSGITEAVCKAMFQYRLPTHFETPNTLESSEQRNERIKIVLDGDSIPRFEVNLGLEPNSLLDLLIFNDTVYLGTEEGLFSTSREDPTNIPVVKRTPQVLFNKPCYHITASLGAVAASCGGEGLFALYGVEPEPRGSEASRPKKVAGSSRRAAFSGTSLFNSVTRTDYELLDVEVEKRHRRNMPDLAVKIEHYEATEALAPAHLLPDYLGEKADLTTFSHRRLLAFVDGTITSSRLMNRKGSRWFAKTVHDEGNYTQQPIDAVAISRGGNDVLFVETQHGLEILSKGTSRVEVVAEPIVALRSYPKSVRYQRLVTATFGGTLGLIGVGRLDRSDWD